MLHILGRALNENEVDHCVLHSTASYLMERTLKKFKEDPNVRALLIPVKCGANGLNLIEATHVLLIEPILNPGSELQAIGRVHRIGQLKPTVVHRFVHTHAPHDQLLSGSFITNLKLFIKMILY